MAKLYMRYAAMGAGKSTQLLQIEHNYTSVGKKVLLLTSAVDNRWGTGFITSRLGVKKEAAVFTASTDMFAEVGSFKVSAGDNAGAVLVDEAQFLSVEQVQQLHRVVHQHGVPVLCFGLRTDFRGMPFPGSAMLLAIADDIEELKTVCVCGRQKATMNVRIDESGQRVRDGAQVLIGDGNYRQVCGSCFYAA